MREERETVARVVDRAKDGRRGNRGRWNVLVEVADLDRCSPAEATRGLGHHLGRRVDSAITEAARHEKLPEAGIAAGEIEYLVAGLECRPERCDEVCPMREIRGGVGVRLLRPLAGPMCVLSFLGAPVFLGAHSA